MRLQQKHQWRKNRLHISNKTQDYYNPGRSGSINLKSENGPQLASFGEIHPAILSNLDLKEQNLSGFEIFLKNIPQPKKKQRMIKKNYSVSEFQKSERDFAFIVDKNTKAQDLINLIKNVDLDLIKDVSIFDLYEGENIPNGKKSLTFKVTIQSTDKTLTDNDINGISKKIVAIIEEKTSSKLRS